MNKFSASSNLFKTFFWLNKTCADHNRKNVHIHDCIQRKKVKLHKLHALKDKEKKSNYYGDVTVSF